MYIIYVGTNKVAVSVTQSTSEDSSVMYNQ